MRAGRGRPRQDRRAGQERCLDLGVEVLEARVRHLLLELPELVQPAESLELAGQLVNGWPDGGTPTSTTAWRCCEAGRGRGGRHRDPGGPRLPTIGEHLRHSSSDHGMGKTPGRVSGSRITEAKLGQSADGARQPTPAPSSGDESNLAQVGRAREARGRGGKVDRSAMSVFLTPSAAASTTWTLFPSSAARWTATAGQGLAGRKEDRFRRQHEARRLPIHRRDGDAGRPWRAGSG